jgi:rare lipoprotein A (peptidoglycan hydrolase)
MQKVSADLDRAAADEERGQTLLQTRVLAIYRSDDAGPLALVMSASSLRDLTMALDLLDRLAGQDAADLRALKVARAKMRGSAETLLTLQGEQARATEALAAEVARARTGLASSEAALKAYQARTAAAVGRTPPRGTPPQGISGSGAWLTGVASMYGRNFTGRGASGEAIGPYSMMVAHKTLPFGTLIEFEYQGKRAVARVADRGPYTKRRDFDLGPGVVRVFDFSGVHPVRYRIIPR